MVNEELPKLPGIGLDMLELIIRVKEKFKKEYNIEPSTREITNLIAQRVNEYGIF